MGNDLSSPPWREPCLRSGPKKREELKQQVKDVKPVAGIPYYNIILVGQIGSGKSSYFNAAKSVMQNCVIKDIAKTGEKAESMTRKLKYLEAHPDLPLKLCDTMGIKNHSEQKSIDADIMNLIKAVRGNVPDGYQFSPGEEFTEENPRFIHNPSAANKAHCVAIVVDASTFKHMNPIMLEGLQNLKDKLDEEEVPVYALLTHMDTCSPAVKKNVGDIHRSKGVHDLVTSAGKKLRGLPENQIFPVINYESITELDNAMDILLLLSLRQMLYSAQSYAEMIFKNNCKSI